MKHAKEYEHLIDEIFAKAMQDKQQQQHNDEQQCEEDEEEDKEKHIEPNPIPQFQFNYLDIKDDDININIDDNTNTNLLSNIPHENNIKPLITVEDDNDKDDNDFFPNKEHDLIYKLSQGIKETKDGKFCISTVSDELQYKDQRVLTSTKPKSSNALIKKQNQSKSRSVHTIPLNTHYSSSRHSTTEKQIKTYLTQNFLPHKARSNINSTSNNSKYHKYNTEQLAYDAGKNYSQCRPKEKGFLSRMKFYAIKQQTRNEIIHILIEKNKPKIKESEKLKTFNRLIEDSNRRAEAKNRIELLNSNKQIACNIYNQEYNASKQKKQKFNLLEFEKKYEEEVTNKIKQKQKAIEQYQQHKQQQEQMKEDKIINEMKKYHKKVPNEEIQRISQRLYNDAIARKIKLNDKRSRSLAQSESIHRQQSESKFNPYKNNNRYLYTNNNNNNSFYSEGGKQTIQLKSNFKHKPINTLIKSNREQCKQMLYGNNNCGVYNNNNYYDYYYSNSSSIPVMTTTIDKNKATFVPYYDAERMINAFFKPK